MTNEDVMIRLWYSINVVNHVSIESKLLYMGENGFFNLPSQIWAKRKLHIAYDSLLLKKKIILRKKCGSCSTSRKSGSVEH